MKPRPSTSVRQHRFDGDERSNIPTAELESFVRDEDKKPTIVRYPRNPDLDPQLVWKGKDEQDSRDLAVPSVPIYVQEKIQPRAIIESIRVQSRKDQPDDFLQGLFNDFNGIDDLDKKIEFYQHSQHW